MKKLLILGSSALFLLIILAIVAGYLFLDSAVKSGVEKVAPMMLKVPVKLDSVTLSPLSGNGSIKGLVVSNPEGYKSPSAIDLGKASLAIQPGSILSDKIIVRSVIVEAPVITFETDLKGNNLSKLMANLESVTGGDDKPDEAAPEEASRKLQVDEFVMTGGKINVLATALGGKGVTVPLPEIRFENLGTGPEGITAAELTSKVLKRVIQVATEQGTKAVADLGKQAIGEAGKIGTDAINQATKNIGGLGGLLKKKPASTNQ